MAKMLILCALFVMILVYAACVAASDADDWSERMRNETRQRQAEDQSCTDRDNSSNSTGADVRGDEVQRPGELEDR